MLNMEVAQQLSKCKTFQFYLEYFKNFNNERNHLSERESELMSDIYNIGLQLVSIFPLFNFIIYH